MGGGGGEEVVNGSCTLGPEWSDSSPCHVLWPLLVLLLFHSWMTWWCPCWYFTRSRVPDLLLLVHPRNCFQNYFFFFFASLLVAGCRGRQAMEWRVQIGEADKNRRVLRVN